MLATNLGSVGMYALGTFFAYNVPPIVGFVIGVIFMIWMTFLPETPLYLCSQTNLKEAEKSIEFYNYELTAKEIIEKRSQNDSKGEEFSLKDLRKCETSLFFLMTEAKIE